MVPFLQWAWIPTVFVWFSTAAGPSGTGVSEALSSKSTYTQTDLFLLLTYVLLALVFSFLCSIAEAALLSTTPSFIAGLFEKKSRLAPLMKKIKQDNIEQSLAAILTLNTIAHTVGAVGSGAKATIVFGSAWFGLFSAVMTLLILFFSEIIPKTLGAVHWRRLAKPTAIFVRTLILSLYPLIKISEWLTRLVAKRKGIHSFNREEFLAMVHVGEQAGKIDTDESRILQNLFRLESLKVSDIMTPRTVISALQQDLTVGQAMDAVTQSPFSRIPVFGRDQDEITGFVLRQDLLLCKAKDQDTVRLKSLKRDILIVVENLTISGLLALLLDKRQHIAVVAGEYGETKGLVTLEDVVETLLGMEIVDESDDVEDMQALARQQWGKRARALGINTEAIEPGSGESAKDRERGDSQPSKAQ